MVSFDYKIEIKNNNINFIEFLKKRDSEGGKRMSKEKIFTKLNFKIIQY